MSVKIKITSSGDIAKNNSRLCLSAYRVFGECFKCNQYRSCESKIISDKCIQHDTLISQGNQFLKQSKEFYKQAKEL